MSVFKDDSNSVQVEFNAYSPIFVGMPLLPIDATIADLKAQLENHLGWGSSEFWSNYDFEQLSERIAQQTGVSLSVSTLKRILGKVDYKSSPSPTTLNTLAQFLKYANWRDFQLRTTQTSETPVEHTISLPRTRKTKRLNQGLALASVFLLGLIVFLLLRKTPYNPADFRFTSNTVLTRGLPNSVVFNFDVSKAYDDDSVFISQSWDIRRKELVDKNDHHHSAIYYYPGFYRAKLMVGGQVLKEHDLQINTDGWLGLVEADWGKEPLYFQPSEIVDDQMVHVTDEMLRRHGIKRGPAAPKTILVNQQVSQGIKTDQFDFSTEVKSLSDSMASGCQRVDVVLHAKNDLLVVPLVEPGCTGDIYLAAYGYYASSRKANLSGFGCHPSQWTRLQVSCQSGLMTFYVNQKRVYQVRIKNRSAEIIGVQVRFTGPGAVRNTSVQSATKKMIF
jgi:hypothetical protein